MLETPIWLAILAGGLAALAFYVWGRWQANAALQWQYEQGFNAGQVDRNEAIETRMRDGWRLVLHPVTDQPVWAGFYTGAQRPLEPEQDRPPARDMLTLPGRLPSQESYRAQLAAIGAEPEPELGPSWRTIALTVMALNAARALAALYAPGPADSWAGRAPTPEHPARPWRPYEPRHEAPPWRLRELDGAGWLAGLEQVTRARSALSVGLLAERELGLEPEPEPDEDASGRCPVCDAPRLLENDGPHCPRCGWMSDEHKAHSARLGILEPEPDEDVSYAGDLPELTPLAELEGPGGLAELERDIERYLTTSADIWRSQRETEHRDFCLRNGIAYEPIAWGE